MQIRWNARFTFALTFVAFKSENQLKTLFFFIFGPIKTFCFWEYLFLGVFVFAFLPSYCSCQQLAHKSAKCLQHGLSRFLSTHKFHQIFFFFSKTVYILLSEIVAKVLFVRFEEC